MTTSITVRVGGNYVARVQTEHANGTSDDQNVIGPGERTFSLAHPAEATFKISERAMSPEEIAERDKPKDPGGDPAPAKTEAQDQS